MREASIRSFVLIGGAAGANSGLAATNQMTDLGGFVFNRLSTKVRVGKVGRTGSGFGSRQHTAPQVATQLQRLIERGVPMLMVSGAEDTDGVRMRRLLDANSPDLDRTSIEMTSVAARISKGSDRYRPSFSSSKSSRHGSGASPRPVERSHSPAF